MNINLKFKIICSLILLSLTVSSLKSQSISLGGGFEYNLSIDEVGYQLRAYYNIGEHICFGPEFTSFGSSTFQEGDEEITESSIEFNFNGHYIFELSHKLGTYPIVGVNHTRIDESYINLTTGETGIKDINTWAANLGWGVHFKINTTSIFFEYHASISKPGDHILSVGGFYNFGDQQEQENSH